MSYKIYNRNNTHHDIRSHIAGQMTCCVTRTGFVQLSASAIKHMGLGEGSGLVLMEDEDYDDYYFGLGDPHRGAFVLTQVGKSARLEFTCSGISDILAKAAQAPADWHWMRLSLFSAPEGKLGLDLKHAQFKQRHIGDLTAAREAREAKKRGRPSKKEGTR